MEKHVSPPSHIFFHMGPGLHSRVEALAFQDKYPHVAFLDQPLDVDFSGLVKWAEEVILQHATLAQKPVTLLGHSFGGSIIRAALPKVAEHVSAIRLLNSAADPFECFVNLGKTLSQGNVDGSSLKKKSVPEKMNFIFHVAQNANMLNAYWTDPRAHKHYMNLAAAFPALNLEAFVKVFPDFLSQPFPAYIWNGPVKILYSLSDSLILNEATILPWKEIYPKAHFQELPGLAHYPHFESADAAEIFFAEK